MKALTPALVLGLSALSIGCARLQVTDAEMQLIDADWADSASSAEICAVCNKIISNRHSSHHDAFIMLVQNGDKTSVPLLIHALRWHPPFEGNGEQLFECTTEHCLAALRSLTGQDFGYQPDQWEKWWTESGAGLSNEQFKPRTANQRLERTGVQPAAQP